MRSCFGIQQRLPEGLRLRLVRRPHPAHKELILRVPQLSVHHPVHALLRQRVQRALQYAAKSQVCPEIICGLFIAPSTNLPVERIADARHAIAAALLQHIEDTRAGRAVDPRRRLRGERVKLRHHQKPLFLGNRRR